MDRDLSQLCLAIHAGVYQRPPWSGFLQLARREFDLDYAGLIFRRPGRDRRVLREFHDSDIDLTEPRLRYRREFYRTDPFAYYAMQPGRVYRLPEMLGGVDPASSTYYRDYLAPAGLRDLLTMRIVEPQRYSGWATFARARPAAFEDDDVAQAMAELSPHLTLALRALARLDGFRIERAIFRRANQQRHLGAVTLGAGLQVLGVGRRAGELMTRAHGVWVGPDAALQFADEALRRRLAETIAGFERGGGEWAFQVSASPPLQALVTPAALEVAGGAPLAILYLHEPPQRPSRPKRPARLISLFGMTPLEARITDALCDGLSFAEIAADLDLTEQTVRSYSKSIFAKVGAQRQAEVVRIVLESLASVL